MKSIALSFAAGLLFGIGLLLSGMTQPAKVVGFLDVLGGWDPSLALVMIGAIATHSLAYLAVSRRQGPLWGGRWAIPSRRDIDTRLLAGAALFGAGWGLGGYCPGPALTSAVSGSAPTLLFVASMLAGMWLFALWEAASAGATKPEARAAAKPDLQAQAAATPSKVQT